MASKKKIHTDMPLGEIYPRLLRYSFRYKGWLGLAGLGMALYAGADTALIYILTVSYTHLTLPTKA